MLILTPGSAQAQYWPDSTRNVSGSVGIIYGGSFVSNWFGYSGSITTGRTRIKAQYLRNYMGSWGGTVEYQRKILNSPKGFMPFFSAVTGYYDQPQFFAPYGARTWYLHAGIGWEFPVYKWFHVYHTMALGLDHTKVFHPSGFKWVPILDAVSSRGFMLKFPISGRLKSTPGLQPEWNIVPSNVGLFIDNQYEQHAGYFSSQDFWHLRGGVKVHPRWYAFGFATFAATPLRHVVAYGAPVSSPVLNGGGLGMGYQIANHKRWSGIMEYHMSYANYQSGGYQEPCIRLGISEKIRCNLKFNTYLDFGINQYFEYYFTSTDPDLADGYSFGIGKRF